MRWRRDPLTGANTAFVVAIILHNTDHAFFQDRGIDALTTEVRVGGTILAAVAVVGFAFTLAGHRWAPLLATVIGFGAAISVLAAHVLPHWGAFSDSYPDRSLGAYSWIVMLSEVLTGFVLGIVGFRTARRRSLATT